MACCEALTQAASFAVPFWGDCTATFEKRLASCYSTVSPESTIADCAIGLELVAICIIGVDMLFKGRSVIKGSFPG